MDSGQNSLSAQEQAIHIEPKTENFSIKGRLSGNIDEIYNRIKSLRTFIIEKRPDGITIVRIDSRDIQKRPFLFFIIAINQNSIDIDYTIAPDTSDSLRRLNVVRNLVSILALIADQYQSDSAELFQYIDSSIDLVVNSLSQSYSTLFNSYQAILEEYREIKKQNIDLYMSNKNLAVDASRLKNENEELHERIKQLENYPDESLMVMVEEWIESHNGTIDVNDFSKAYTLPSTRTEEILNKMISLGYIALKE